MGLLGSERGGADDRFEYLSVLLSVILGLAITQILEGYRALLLARARVRLHWPTLLWTVLLLLFVAQSWWASFGLERQGEWRFTTFLVILLQMGLTYLLAALVLPDVPEAGAVDLTAHFERQRRPFFFCLLLVVLTSLAKEWMLDGRLPEPLNLGFHVLLMGVAVTGLIVRRTTVHLALALFVAVIFGAYVGVLFARL
ncbi:hypothetical protein [Qipengyuania sediminis]|uniref:hypothetical protein n=1 Tax=Qipengyuania sediminis TaxID=1532023 RepID=UPI00105A4708|nr:hypothetical protein [Qipengyuania sediminis]